MASKVFFDANILLDLTLERTEYKNALALFEQAGSGIIKAFTSASVIQIASYWMVKALGVKETKEELLLILSDVQVIDLPHDMALRAIQSSINDIEDALQYFTALHHKMEFFITGDRKLKKDAIPMLPVFTASEFIANSL